MKATMILLLISSRMAFGQSPLPARQWLRVALHVDIRLRTTTEGRVQDSFMTELRKFGAAQDLRSETESRVQDLFTRQLRKLGDVQVVPLLLESSKEGQDVKLRVLVSATLEPQQNSQRLFKIQSYAVTVVATRPVLDGEAYAGSWLEVTVERNFETTCANLITKFDHEVLEADRKRIRFPEAPGHSRSDASATDQFPEPPPAPTPAATVPPALLPEPGVGSGKGGGFGPGEVGGNRCDLKPVLIHKVEPKVAFSDLLKKLPPGDVLLSVEVDPTGHVVNPIVVRSLDMRRDEKAVEAVLQWRFRPGTDSEGKPVSCHASITVSYPR